MQAGLGSEPWAIPSIDAVRTAESGLKRRQLPPICLPQLLPLAMFSGIDETHETTSIYQEAPRPRKPYIRRIYAMLALWRALWRRRHDEGKWTNSMSRAGGGSYYLVRTSLRTAAKVRRPAAELRRHD